MIPTLQYVTNENGEKTSIVMSINEWQAFYQRYKKLENKILFLKEFEESVEEVKLIRKGKKKAKSLSEFLNEL